MATVSRLISIATLLLVAGLALAGPGSQLGWWDYGTGLRALRNGMPYVQGAMALTLAGVVVSLIIRKKGTVMWGLLAIAAGAIFVITVTGMFAKAGGNPIHDLTTDFDNPPQIIAGAGAERKNPARYTGADPVGKDDGKTVAETQAEIYPDLAPQTVSADAQSVFDAALAVAEAMPGFTVLATIRPGQGTPGTIEATHKSRVFGFVDDFIIRITPIEAGGTRVDYRSKSRVGRSDLGANAARIRSFQNELRARVE